MLLASCAQGTHLDPYFLRASPVDILTTTIKTGFVVRWALVVLIMIAGHTSGKQRSLKNKIYYKSYRVDSITVGHTAGSYMVKQKGRECGALPSLVSEDDVLRVSEIYCFIWQINV